MSSIDYLRRVKIYEPKKIEKRSKERIKLDVLRMNLGKTNKALDRLKDDGIILPVNIYNKLIGMKNSYECEISKLLNNIK